ncbi:AzlC family ABC transporter permease [Streptomyces sp. DG2A-72]|uniref:AzlC family ABC transporter permease n=1 Tax=Streptomyces sp. DG2A-72 TaxID=3051386 RepID=UPI00265BFE41|nr:AzlC family ABC transporter permease [Streptomyces sp. DG2A-72]MDO0935484.1 AzlC family ABC transporter permease [Streptomyces sp. DG2A-72]
MRSLLRTPMMAPLVRDSALVWLASGVVGVSFGAVSVAGGLPVWVPVVMSLVVYAGSAQFSAVGVLLAGGGPFAAAATGLLLNTRTAAFSLAVADVLGSRSRFARFLGAHLVTDETVAFTLAQPDPVRHRTAFWVNGLGLFAAWNTGVLAGALAGSALGDTATYGLDAAFPAVLVALVLPALRKDAGVRRAAVLGAVVALAVTPAVPAGVPVLFALAGLFVYGRRRAAA